MVQIKICGITNKEEIDYINILRPEYIGFVFTKSKRQVNSKQAKALYSSLNKEIKTVGVFKDNSLNEILEIISEVPLNVIQLHGKEDENFISSLKDSIGKPIKIWKALSISDTENIKKYAGSMDKHLVDNILIDGDKPGSGETFSLENIYELLTADLNDETSNLNYKTCNFFLAGGITPENVAERIKKANPAGVDVSSGVEIINEDGIRTKSYEKMKSLIEKVKSVKS